MKNRLLRSAVFGLGASLALLLLARAAMGHAAAPYALHSPARAPAPMLQSTGSPVSGSPVSGNPITVTGSVQGHALYLPAIAGGAAPPDLNVDIRNRADVLALYAAYHETAPSAAMGWTGDRSTCNAGDTTLAYRKSLQDLVNYFRTMAGVPAQITFSDEYNAKAQQAALMLSVNGELSHEPPPTWQCYSAAGAEAAGRSNVSIWQGIGGNYHGIKGQMEDEGDNNAAVGHRRWILCPATKVMGTGDVPEGGEFMAANALWVQDDNWMGPRPAVRDEFIAWPPSGYVPDNTVYPRWSFSLRDADFSAASVRVTYKGADLTIQREPEEFNICENTLVWIPSIDWKSLSTQEDHRFDVEIAGVQIDGSTRTFTYDVHVVMVD